MISPREQHLMDSLDLAIHVIDGLSAELWQTRIALVAAISGRLNIDPVVVPRARASAPAVMPFRTPRRYPSNRRVPNPGRDDAIVAALTSHGPLLASDVARIVLGSMEITGSQASGFAQALRRLERENRVLRLADQRYDVPREDAVALPPVEATALEDAS